MATLKSVEYRKNRSSIFPAVETLLLTSSISVVVSCSGANSVNYKFIASGETGTIQPGKEKELITNSDAITDSIEFTFVGAATINVVYSEGASSGGGGTTADVVALLTKKADPGTTFTLRRSDTGLPPTFPFAVLKFSLNISGEVYSETYEYAESAEDMEDLVKIINRYQKEIIFKVYSPTQLIAVSGTSFHSGIIEWAIESFAFGSPYIIFRQNIIPVVGEPSTSWGDDLLTTINESAAILRNLSSAFLAYHYVLDGSDPTVGYENVKELSFVVVTGTVICTLDGINSSSSVTFPIVGDVTIQGTSYSFSSPNPEITFHTFSVGALVYVQLIRY